MNKKNEGDKQNQRLVYKSCVKTIHFDKKKKIHHRVIENYGLGFVIFLHIGFHLFLVPEYIQF